MAIPGRNASQEDILRPSRTFFVTTKTSMGRRLLQSERNAGLLIEILRELVKEHVFELHDFVVMPDHVHLLFTVGEEMTIEKAVQLVKGRFSFRLKKEHGYLGEVWQRGFSEVQVMGRENFETHRRYIAENPAKARLVAAGEEYPFCYQRLVEVKAEAKAVAAGLVQQGLKPY
jgi:putative transposase